MGIYYGIPTEPYGGSNLLEAPDKGLLIHSNPYADQGSE
jgi:hypothetical protein